MRQRRSNRLENSRRGNRRSNSAATMDEARSVSEGFHGREAKFIEDIIEVEHYRKNLAQLGELIEIEVVDRRGKSVIPLSFPPWDTEEHVDVASTPNRKQLIIAGGDQCVDLMAFVNELSETELEKDYICLGETFSISYYTDKHHLEGPEYQKDGTEYIHKFGEEEGGTRPYLFYDRLNEHLLLVGGSYEVRDNGIYN